MNALASSMVGKMKIRFTLPAYDCFELLDRDGYLLVAQHTAPALRHKDVVLDADAAEVAVAFQGVVIDDPLVKALGSAFVDQPLAAGVTVNRSGDGAAATGGPKSAAEGTGHAAGDAGFAEPHPGFTADDRAGHAADGTQRQTPEGNPENTSEGYLPEVENMEGAAFFAVCDALGVACCQIRAVSNYVGEPFGQWAVEEAVGNLTEKLNQIFENNE